MYNIGGGGSKPILAHTHSDKVMYGHSLNGVIDGRYVYCLKLLFIIRNLSAIIVQSWVRLKIVVYF